MSKKPENKTSTSTWRTELFICLALVVSCLFVYLQTFSFDLINIDDRAFIYENPMVLSGLNFLSVQWAFTAFHSANWNPITWISHMLDVTLFGNNWGYHHATNVVFHSLNGVLSFYVFRKLSSSIWIGAVIALLFAVHPAHVESVAWVAERRDVLSTFFWLATMLAYFQYVSSSGKASMWYSTTVAFFALGLMSKPMLVTLPFVLILCDFWSLDRLKTVKDLLPLVKEKLPLFALTAVSSVITYAAQSSGGATVSLESLSVFDRILNASTSYGRYALMMFYPADLGIWYPMPARLDPLEAIASIIFLAAVTFFAWRYREDHKYLLMGWLWFLGTLVPVIGIVQVGGQSHADRYTYVPYFGLFIMIVCGVAHLIRSGKISLKIAAPMAAVWIIGLTWAANVQASKWKNSGTLYEHTLEVTGKNPMVQTNLCLYYVRAAPPAYAEQRCTQLLADLAPTGDGYNVLGLLRMQLGRYDEAIGDFRRGIELRADWGILYAHLTVALAGKDDLAGAETALKQTMDSTDGSVTTQTKARVLFEYAAALERAGRIGDALRYYSEASTTDPSFAEAGKAVNRLQGKAK